MNPIRPMLSRLLIFLFCLLFHYSFLNAQITYTALHTEASFANRITDINLAVGSTPSMGDASSGSALYNIPIVVPPGTNGVMVIA